MIDGRGFSYEKKEKQNRLSQFCYRLARKSVTTSNSKILRNGERKRRI